MVVYSDHYHHMIHDIHSLFLVPEEITVSCTLSKQCAITSSSIEVFRFRSSLSPTVTLHGIFFTPHRFQW